jgi:hypothetical protein
MTSKHFTTHFFTLVILLIGILIGCGVTPPTTQDPEGNGDPSLSAMPVAALLRSIAMPVTRAITRSTTTLPTPEIKLTFAASMNRSSVENAINVYPSGITPNSSIPKRLQVKATCDGGWQVRNPNNTAVSFEWGITKSVEQGAGMVAANGVQNLRTSTGFKQLRVISSGIVQARVLSVSGTCVPTLEFIWAVDNKSVTVRPLQPMSSDALTVALSTGAFSSDGVRLEHPSTETLVPEQELKESQTITLTFPQAVNKSVLENSLKFFQGKFDPGTLIPTAPRVLQACDGSYTILNPSSSVLVFSWSVEGSSETGQGEVSANGEIKVTPLKAGALKVFTSTGANVTRVLEGSTACSSQVFTTVWSVDGSSVTLTPVSKLRVGTFTITGSAVNEAGASVARESLSVVRVIADDAKPDPDPDPVITPEAPLRAEVDLESFPVVATSGETNTFSGFSSGGSSTDPNAPEPTIDWDFGDGTTATGAEVEHLFVDPDTYSVTIKVTNSSGISDSVTQNVTVFPTLKELSKSFNLTEGNHTVNLDFSRVPEGINVETTFFKADGSVLSEQTSKTPSLTLPKLGTYEVGVRMLDYRDTLQTRSRTRSARAATPETGDDIIARQILNDRVWFTSWEKRPIAKIETRVSGSLTKALILKQDGSSIELDASKSSFPDSTTAARYEWEICKLNFGRCTDPKILDGDTSAVRNVSFTGFGEYTVHLTLTDGYGQVDESDRYVIVKNGERAFIVSRFEYPTGARIATRSSVQPNNNQFKSDFSVANALRSKRSSVDFVEDTFPTVLHKSAIMNLSAARWNDWSNKATFQKQLCASTKAYFNGLEWASTIFESYEAPDNPYYDPLGWWTAQPPVTGSALFCDFLMINRTVLNSNFFARSNNEILYSGSQWFQTLDFDVADGFRVPEMILSVLPDEALPGDAFLPDSSIKAVEESYSNVDGKKTMILTVRMRRSDLERGKLTFKVPVYAVDPTGKVMTATNGNFFAKFANLDNQNQNCGDCVMIHGKAYLEVSIDPQAYAMNTPNPFKLDLHTLTLGSDAAANNDWDCASTDSPLSQASSNNHTLRGCSSVYASSELPTGFEDVAPFEIQELSNAKSYFGIVLFGATAAAADKFLDYLKDGFWKDIRKMIDWIPVLGSTVNFFEAVAACVNKAPATPGLEGEEAQKCDPMGLIMAGAGVILDVLPGVALAFKPLGAIFKASRLGKIAFRAEEVAAEAAGGTARLMSELTQEALTGGARGFEAMKTKLGEVFSEGWNTLKSCIAKCSKEADEVLANGVKFGDSLKVFGKKVEDFLVTVKNKFIPVACALKTVAVQVTAGIVVGVATQATLEWVSEYFFGYTIKGEEVVDQPQEDTDFQELNGVRQGQRISTRANAGGRRNCDTTKLAHEASQKPNSNHDFEDAHKTNDPGYHKLPSPKHSLVLTAHHIVPINLDKNVVCARNLKSFNGAMKNPCTLMKAMLRYSRIDPYVNICNIVLLPGKGVVSKKAKTNGFDGINGNPSLSDWEADFRSEYPSAVEHTGLNSYKYVDAIWEIMSVSFEAEIKHESNLIKRRLLMCTTLQGIATYLLYTSITDPRNAKNPFISSDFRKF